MKTASYRPLLACAVALAASATASAQTPFTFDINQSQSNWTFSGTTSLGPIQGNPSNMFQVAGTADVILTGGGSPVGAVQFASANALVTPDISAIVPNPLPFLPPLASIDLIGVTLSLSSTSGAVDGSGFFTVVITPLVLSGTAIVDVPIVGQQTIDLAGTPGNPTLVTAQLLTSPGAFTVTSGLIDDTFDLSDPTSGLTATLNIVGSVEADYTCPASLVGAPASLSLASGGVQSFELNTCVEHTNDLYVLLGTVSGTAPGFPTAAGVLPLNPDPYFNYTLNHVNQFPLANSFGVLDASGVASASFTLPPAFPGLLGVVFHHAYLVLDGSLTVSFVSNAVPLTITP